MQTRSTQQHSSRYLLGLGILVVVTAALVVGLELTDTTHFFHKQKLAINSPATPTLGGASTNSSKGESQPTTTSGPTTDGSKSTSPTSQVTPVSPFGDFVSNHTPGQHSSPMTEASVCNTTSGATCQIFFSDGSITKSLPVQTTDLNGSTYWNNWTPASIGLTQGSWQITAVATINGQSKSTTDPINLEVQ